MTALDQLYSYIEAWTGICLARGGAAESLRRFAGGRAKELGLPSVEAYVEQLSESLRQERELLANAVAVNYTWFYRDEEQMASLGRLLREGWPAGAELNLWVPGCATGEDAYGLAMLAARAGRAVTVLGTDLSSASIAFAREGRYGAWSTRELPDELRPFFAPAESGAQRVVDELRRRVSFEVHNLVDVPKRPSGAGWDLVLCRNVLIYFSREGAEAAHERMGVTLAPRGFLVLGATESVWREPPGLKAARVGGRAALYRPERAGEEVPASLLLAGAQRAAKVGAGFASWASTEPAAAQSAPSTGAGFGSAAGPTASRSGPGLEPAPLAPAAVAPARREADAQSLVAEGGRLMATRLADSISPLMRARELDPLCVEAHLHLGIAFHLSGDAVSAAPPLRSALLLDPSLWPAALYLALSYENLGQPEEAQREYRRVVDLSGGPLTLEVRGVLGDMEAWKADVLALARRRAARR